MTTKTRRRVFWSVLALAMTLPVETLFLQELAPANSAVAARQWAQGLDANDLASAASQIESYPFAYRQAIMAELSPADRAEVWQNHILGYVAAHPELDGTTVGVLQTAAQLATADNLSAPSDDTRDSITAVGAQVEALLGRSTMWYLLYELGPADTPAPATVSFTAKLRNFLGGDVLNAQGDQCDCSVEFGCYDPTSTCSSDYSCQAVQGWPACGLFWDYTCDGDCASGS